MSTISVPVQTILDDALTELGVLGAGEATDPSVLDFVLGKFKRILDNLNAERAGVYTTQFIDFTITPSLQPHTIGPTAATITVDQRPVSIEAADLVLNNVTPNVYQPLRLVDDAWWMNQPVPDLTSTIPTDLYYSPAWENGEIFIWPVPTTAYGVRLLARLDLSQLDLPDVFYFPPGYRDAVTLTLAEELAPAFHVEPSPRTTLSAMRARAKIFANNDVTPAISTLDAGMPGSQSRTGCWNYKSGFPFGY